MYQAIKQSNVAGLSGSIEFDSSCVRKGPHEYAYVPAGSTALTALGSFDGTKATLSATPPNLLTSDRIPAHVTALIVCPICRASTI